MKRGYDENDRDAAGKSQPRGPKSFYSLQEALNWATTEIFHAMRLARGFERQKLGRRQKDAQQNNSADDIVRIDGEITVLKGFDLAPMAEFYLYKTLLRIPSISSAPQFPASIATKVAESKKQVDSTYLSVSARLFKSNAVSSALESSLKAIYEVIGVEPQLGRKKRMRKGDFKPASHIGSNQPPESGPTRDSVLESESVVSLIEPEAMPDQVTDGQVKSEMADDDLASGAPRSENLSSSDSSESDPDLSGEEKSSSEVSDSVPGRKLGATRGPLTTTAFLPSLAGGYISGSDSEASDIDDPEDRKTIKNRPGQRARQAHWERKYGTNADHIKKQRQSRDYGWDAKRGAQDLATKGTPKSKLKTTNPPKHARTTNYRDRKPQPAFNSQTRTKPAAMEQRRSLAKAEVLHPSWEAARKQKEQKNAAAFQGKKIVFD